MQKSVNLPIAGKTSRRMRHFIYTQVQVFMMNTDYHSAYYASEIGIFKIAGTNAGVQALEFTDETKLPEQTVPMCLKDCFDQLDEYFAGERKTFQLNLLPEGTAFQQAVWQQLRKIPYGSTSTYLNVAKALGKPKAIRAVGAANGRNRIPIIIPCHRVIGSNGALIGFGGGLWRKEFLLKHEKALLV